VSLTAFSSSTCPPGVVVDHHLERARPALKVNRQQDGPGTRFDCDPSNLHETPTTTTEYGPHQMTEADPRELRAVLRRVQGQGIRSG
jgi:hypothetical protein